MVRTRSIFMIAGLASLIISTGVVALSRVDAPRTKPSIPSTGAVASAATNPAPAAAPVAAPPPPKPPVGEATVVLYGDSLAWEAEHFFRDALVRAGVASVWTHTYGGTAICDWFEQMRLDASDPRPTIVVVEFSGNALTPCMADASGVSLGASRDAYEQKYMADANEVLRIFSDSSVHVLFVGAPVARVAAERNDPYANWLNLMYAQFSLFAPQVTYVDAGAAVLRDGYWTETLPCLPFEPCVGGTDVNGVGVNVVRAPDGGHFCPGAPNAQRGVTARCAIWSSGAFRYGNAMAEGVLGELSRQSVA
jgi:hypothetical protein